MVGDQSRKRLDWDNLRVTEVNYLVQSQTANQWVWGSKSGGFYCPYSCPGFSSWNRSKANLYRTKWWCSCPSTPRSIYGWLQIVQDTYVPLTLGHKIGYVAFVSPSQNSFLSPTFRSVQMYKVGLFPHHPSHLSLIWAQTLVNRVLGRWECLSVASNWPGPFPFQRREEPVHHSQRGVWSRQDGVGQVCHALLHHGQWLGQWHQHRREGPGIQSHHGGKAVQMSLASLAGAPSAGSKTAERPASRGWSQSSWRPLTWSAVSPLSENPLSAVEGNLSKVPLKTADLGIFRPGSPGPWYWIECSLHVFLVPWLCRRVSWQSFPVYSHFWCPVPSCHPVSANQCPTESFLRGQAPLNQ